MIWLSAWCIVSFWILTYSPVLVAQISLVATIPLLLLAFVSLAFAGRCVDCNPDEGRWWPRALIGFAAFGAAWIITWPFSATPLVLGVALMLPSRCARCRSSLDLLAWLMAATGCAALVVRRLMVVVHEVPALAGVWASVLRSLGCQASASGAVTTVATPNGSYMVTPTLGGLGAYGLCLFVATVLVLAGRRLISVRAASLAVLTIVGFAFVRGLLLDLMAMMAESQAIRWNPWLATASWLPLPVLLAVLCVAERTRSSSAAPATGALLASFVGVAGLVALATFALVHPNPGEDKSGRIVFHEAHSEWEMVGVPLDWRTYGRDTSYNYSALRRYLAHFYDVLTLGEPLESGSLRPSDILVVKTPTEAYASAEIDEIERFVHAGGSVFLIGDHTNVFGTSTYLNPIARRFNIEFVHDSTHDALNGGLTYWRAPASRPHPIAEHVPEFLFATSCSLTGSPLLEYVQVGRAMKVLPADYARRSFFSEHDDYPLFTHGDFLQTAATSHGRGRVLAFSDSTVWSNFFMHVPGKPELMLASMAWLNRRQSSGWTTIFALLVACSLMVLLLGRGAWRRAAGVVLLTAGHCGVAAGLVATSCIAPGHVSLPSPTRDLHEVSFAERGCDYFLPTRRLIGPRTTPHYLTFYNNLLRVGLTPRVHQAPLANGALPRRLVLVRPTAAIGTDNLRRIARHVREGGRVLALFDDPDPLGELLSEFGIHTTPVTEPLGHVLLSDGPALEHVGGGVPDFVTLVGGEALALDSAGGVVACRVDSSSDGVLVACGACQRK